MCKTLQKISEKFEFIRLLIHCAVFRLHRDSSANIPYTLPPPAASAATQMNKGEFEIC